MHVKNFWDSIDWSAGPDSCWPWTQGRFAERQSRKGGGYGAVYVAGKVRGSHRVAWCLANDVGIDSLATDQLVMHSCDNPICCNPSHLSVGTHADNRRDRDARGRAGDSTPINPVRGVDNHKAKLTEDDVRAIRQSTDTVSGLSRSYQIARSTVRQVIEVRTWKHVL